MLLLLYSSCSNVIQSSKPRWHPRFLLLYLQNPINHQVVLILSLKHFLNLSIVFIPTLNSLHHLPDILQQSPAWSLLNLSWIISAKHRSDHVTALPWLSTACWQYLLVHSQFFSMTQLSVVKSMGSGVKLPALNLSSDGVPRWARYPISFCLSFHIGIMIVRITWHIHVRHLEHCLAYNKCAITVCYCQCYYLVSSPLIPCLQTYVLVILHCL